MATSSTDIERLGARALLEELQAEGIDLQVDGPELIVRARKGSLTTELRTRLSQRRDALVAILKETNGTGDDLPLTAGQRQLWLAYKAAPESYAYSVALTCRIRGTMDVGALERSLEAIWRRHDALRVRIVDDDGVPRQRIASDELHLDLVESVEPLADRVRSEIERPFDLAVGPLFRATLLRGSADVWFLCLVAHHIVFDAWSGRLVLRELEELYAAATRRLAWPVERSCGYREFVARDRQRRRGARFEDDLSWWKRTLAKLPPPLELPADHKRPDVSSPRGGLVSTELSAGTAGKLAGLAQAMDATPFMVHAALVGLVLGRLGGTESLTLGVPRLTRDGPGSSTVVGFGIDTTVLTIDLSLQPRFDELVSRVARSSFDTFAHGDVSLDHLVTDLGYESGALFRVMFNHVTLPAPQLSLGDARVEVEETMPGTRYDLTVYVHQREASARYEIAYAEDLFDRHRVEHLLAQLRHVAEALARAPDTSIGDVSLRTSDAPLPDPRTELASEPAEPLPVEILARAAEDPSRPAVLTSAEVLSRGELERASSAVSSRLQELGVSRGDRVAILGRRSSSWITAVHGVLRAQGSVVILDVAYPDARLAEVMRAAKPRGAIVLPGVEERSQHLIDELDRLAFRIALPPPSTDRSIAPEIRSDDEAYVGFTSGSIGRPRGIVGEHGPLGHFASWYRRELGIDATDRVAFLSGVAHDPAFRDTLVPLSLGAAICIPDREPLELGAGLIEWLRDVRVTVVHWPPSLARFAAASAPGSPPLADLRTLIFGGESMSARDVVTWAKLAPNAECIHAYGATETPQIAACHRLGTRDSDAPGVPIGRGIEGVQLLIVNDAGNLAGVGEPGEIVVRSAFLARGYLSADRDRSERAFEQNPFASSSWPHPTTHPAPSGTVADRVYWTGDVGRYRPNGEVEFLGRRDDQWNVRGVRVEREEIVSALLGLPGIREAEVLMRTGPSGANELTAFVVSDELSLDDEVRDALREVLPAARIPGRIELLDQMPLTPNGKPDRRALLRTIEEERAALAPVRVLDPLEREIAAAWIDVLSCDEPRPDDDFFALGGHSLAAAQIAASLRGRLGVELPLAAVLTHRTPAALARVIRHPSVSEGGSLPPLEPADRGGSFALSFAQERFWLASQARPDSPPDTLVELTRTRGVREGLLDQALVTLEQRHEILRTTFFGTDDGPRQRVVQPRRSILERIEIRSEAGRDFEATVAAAAAALSRAPFDLALGPAWRVTLLAREDGEQALLVVLHHIVADGLSMPIFVRELEELYEAAAQRRRPELTPLHVQYGDFAAWQRSVASSAGTDIALSWWRDKMDGSSDVVLPIGGSVPTGGPGVGRSSSASLPAATLDAVDALGRRTGTTRFGMLLSAFVSVLARASGRGDVFVTSPVGARPHAGVEPLIGPFLNEVLIRMDLSSDPTLESLLLDARSTTLEAFRHADVPVERVLENLERTPEQGLRVYFNLLDKSESQLRLARASCTPLPRPVPGVRGQLSLHVVIRGDVGELICVYDGERFAEAQMEQLLVHVLEFLDAITTDAAQRVSEVCLSRPGERRASGAGVESVDESAIGGRFLSLARSEPDRPAIIEPSGEVVRYGELACRVTRLGLELHDALGSDAGRVGILLGKGASQIAAIFAVLAAGKTYVPLETSLPPSRLRSIAADAELEAIVTDAPNEALGRALAPITFDVGVERPPGGAMLPTVDPRTSAYILYTSGSTGAPKGVVQSHRNVMAHARVYRESLSIQPSDRLSLLSTFGFDAAVMDIFGALLGGAALCPIELSGDGLETLPDTLEALGVSVVHATPTVFRWLTESMARSRVALEAVRAVVLGGEAVDASDLKAFLDEFDERCRFVNGLGPTESTMALQYTLERHRAPSRASVPIGYPVPGTGVTLETAMGEQSALYGVGEIVLRSERLATGYWRREEEQARAFRAASDPHQRAYRTGDLGRLLPDGSIEFAGRADDQVKIRGHRVEPAEIEAALRRISGVKRAVVVSSERTNGETELIAWLTPESVDPEAVQDALRRAFPPWMVPSRVVMLARLPETSTGKVDRRSLAGKSPPPSARTASAVPPRDPLESRLLQLWSDTLDRPVDSVDDDFFALGGSSLDAVRLLERVRRQYGCAPGFDSFNRAASVSSMAAIVRNPNIESAEPMVVPMSFASEGDTVVFVAPPGHRAMAYFALLHASASSSLGSAIAIETPPLGPRERTVSGIAARVVDKLPRERWSRAALVGYSNGGTLAYEIAAMLEASGTSVSALVLLDPSPPSRVLRSDELPSFLERFDEGSRKVLFLDSLRRRMGLADGLPGSAEIHRAAGDDWCRAARLAGALPNHVRDDDVLNLFDRYLESARSTWNALAVYEPSPYRGPLDLLRAASRASGFDIVPGWRQLARELHVHEVPGDHESFLQEPHVKATAKILVSVVHARRDRPRATRFRDDSRS